MLSQPLQATCCIVGGGPAGIMLGFLLARPGIDVIVLEKHRDFLRDFRGDTIHPSTLQLMDELGLLEEFLAAPASGSPQICGADRRQTRSRSPISATLPTTCKFIALMPQWDFLNFLDRGGQPLSGVSTCGWRPMSSI